MFSDVGRPHELSSPQSGCFTLIVCPKPNYFPAWSKVCFAPWPVGCCKCLSHIHSGQHDLNQIGKTTVQNSLRFNKKANMLFDMLNLRFPRWTLLLSNYLPIKILLNCQILREISRTPWRFLGSSGVFHPGWPGWPTFPPKNPSVEGQLKSCKACERSSKVRSKRREETSSWGVSEKSHQGGQWNKMICNYLQITEWYEKYINIQYYIIYLIWCLCMIYDKFFTIIDGWIDMKIVQPALFVICFFSHVSWLQHLPRFDSKLPLATLYPGRESIARSAWCPIWHSIQVPGSFPTFSLNIC